MRILITGAAGRVGRWAVRALEPRHDLVLVDRRRIPGWTVVRADLTRRRSLGLPGTWLPGRRGRWQRHLQDVDVVIHLASAPRPGVPWAEHFRHGLMSARNVLHAAASAGVPRVILASSHHAILARVDGGGPDPFDSASGLPGSRTTPRPRSYYGLTKGAAELMARMLVDRGDLESAVAVRIGSFEETEPTREPNRSRWLSPADLARILHHAVEADYTGFHVVYGVGLEQSDTYDLAGTREFMGLARPTEARAPDPITTPSAPVRLSHTPTQPTRR